MFSNVWWIISLWFILLSLKEKEEKKNDERCNSRAKKALQKRERKCANEQMDEHSNFIFLSLERKTRC